MDYKNKYLKYKQKYLNLKKMIGGGIDASYTITGDQLDQLTLTYKMDGFDNQIKFTILNEIGSGSFGIVSLIRNNKNGIQYIFKKGKDNTTDSYKEGKLSSDLLEDILDDDMLVLYQGTQESDFLISRYNGKDLYKEFKGKKQQIKEQYANVTTQLLDLLHKINRSNIFHNDIKLANITFKKEKVYLIDFGLLSQCNSQTGTLISMSYNGVIADLTKNSYTKYNKMFPTLQKFLKNTDIVGFFYCCIDLLFTVYNYESFSGLYLFTGLNIFNSSNDEEIINRLFELYYFILPKTIRDKLSNDNIQYYNDYDDKLPKRNIALDIFISFPEEHTNLFRFMAYIYNKIKDYLIKNPQQDLWYKKFLKHMSACFLPTFNYKDFKPEFNKIVLEFSILPDKDKIYYATEKDNRDKKIVEQVKYFYKFIYLYYNDLDIAKRYNDPDFLRILRISYHWLTLRDREPTENEIKKAIADDNTMIADKKSSIDEINKIVVKQFNEQFNEAKKMDRDKKIVEQVTYLFNEIATKFIYLYYNELDENTRNMDPEFLRILRISYHWLKSVDPTKKQIKKAIDDDEKMIADKKSPIDEINNIVVKQFNEQFNEAKKMDRDKEIVEQVTYLFKEIATKFIYLYYNELDETTRNMEPDFLRILRISYHWLKSVDPTEKNIIKAIDDDEKMIADKKSPIDEINNIVVKQFNERFNEAKKMDSSISSNIFNPFAQFVELFDKGFAALVPAEKAAAALAPAEKAAAEKAAAEKAAAERAAAERAAAKKYIDDLKQQVYDMAELTNEQFFSKYISTYNTTRLNDPNFLRVLRMSFYYFQEKNDYEKQKDHLVNGDPNYLRQFTFLIHNAITHYYDYDTNLNKIQLNDLNDKVINRFNNFNTVLDMKIKDNDKFLRKHPSYDIVNPNATFLHILRVSFYWLEWSEKPQIHTTWKYQILQAIHNDENISNKFEKSVITKINNLVISKFKAKGEYEKSVRKKLPNPAKLPSPSSTNLLTA